MKKPIIPLNAAAELPEIPSRDALLVNWWFQVLTVLQRHFEAIESGQQTDSDSFAALVAQLGALGNTVTALQTAVAALQAATSSSVTPEQLQALSDSLTQALNDHIGSNIVHGTTSAVVGVTDEQSLEAKTIGLTSPRQGRFRHKMAADTVTSSEVVTVEAGDQMIVAGPFYVAGTLNVSGLLVVL